MEDVFRVDAADSEAFLRACYTQSGALSQYSLISREILKSRYSAIMAQEAGISLEEAAPRDAKGGINPALLSAALARRPIVLLGDVGVGKTMFIRHLVNVDAKDLFGDAITLYVDFLAEPALVTDLSVHVYRSIEGQLLDKYGVDLDEDGFVQSVYRAALQRFDSSVLGRLRDIDQAAYERERIRFLVDKRADLEGHLRSSLEHLVKGRRKQVIVFRDNIDQRPPEFQEQVYSIAHAMGERWPVAVFVSLRPSTFFSSKKRGALAAYQPRVFSIAPPRIDVVLERRLSYVLERLRGSGEFESLPEVYVSVDKLIVYVESLLNSIRRNRDLVQLLDNLSGGNVRRALDFVQTFIGSGNVDTEKVLAIAASGGSYVIEVHQFLRAILLGDYQDYDPESSPIVNVFDLMSSDGREHFLLPLLLAELQRLGETGAEEGYVRATAAYDFGQRMSFRPVQVAWALERAVARDLLEARGLDESEGNALYRLTSVGAYSVKKLPEMFAYLDTVVLDTPITDVGYRSKIVDAHTIADRVTRAELFRLYLDRE